MKSTKKKKAIKAYKKLLYYILCDRRIKLSL